MGCTSSSIGSPNGSAARRQQLQQGTNMLDENMLQTHNLRTSNNKKQNETILQAYQRMDEEMCTIERTCPGPRLATVEAWIEHLETIDSEITKPDEMLLMGAVSEKQGRQATQLTDSVTKINYEIEEIDQVVVGDVNQMLEQENDEVIKVRHLTLQLDVAFDKEKASVHEEFLAKVSRNVISIVANQLRQEMIEHSKKRAVILMETYNKLRYLYNEQDSLISAINGGSYVSKIEEKLDADLETARQVRDKLGSVSEQWRTSAALLRTCAKAALQSVEYWTLVGPSIKPIERITLALDCRNSIISSLVAFEGAQNALPQVEIPYITPRQASAVRHANIYLLTDMANEARYSHIQKVFEAFQLGTSKAVDWLHETYKRTLKKDLDDAEDCVLTIAKQLRQERVKHLSERNGTKIYVPTMVDVM